MPGEAPFVAMADPERMICSVLGGEPQIWHDGVDPTSVSPFLEAGSYHGVLPLLDAKFHRQRDFERWPGAILVACREATLAQALHELAHRAEVLRVLDTLANAGIRPLLLKGTGLAYGVYESPVLRPRADTDLLVRAEQGPAAHAALRGLGYRRSSGPAGRFVGYQVDLRRCDRNGHNFSMDLHWRISNDQVLAWLFTFDELAAASIPVPALGSHAARLGNAESLVLALLHRAGNIRFHPPDFCDRLIWLYDIWLLVDAMSVEEIERFRGVVEEKRIVAVALDGLRRCADCLVSNRLTNLIRDLQQSPVARSGANVLQAGTLHFEWLEFRALPTGSARLAYVAGRLFPNPEYMRERYPDDTDTSFAILYLRRLLEGVRRRLTDRHA